MTKSAEKAHSANLAKLIRAETIWDRLRSILGASVTSDSCTGDHIGDEQAVRAFADLLNQSALFRGDGLALEPGNLAGCKTIGCIATAIISWYQRNGWQVVV